MNDRYWVRTLIAVTVFLVLVFVLVVVSEGNEDLGSPGLAEVSFDVFGDISESNVTRIDVIGYQGEFSIFLSPASETTHEGGGGSRVGFHEADSAPARNDRVSGFVETVLSTEDVRLVTTNPGRHEELGVAQVEGPDALQPGEYILNIWARDQMHTLFVGVSGTVDVVYLRGHASDAVYATADTVSLALSRHIDWFVDYRLFQGLITRNEIGDIRFSGLVDVGVHRLDRGFTSDSNRSGVEAAAATTVSRLLSLEGEGFLSEPVHPEDTFMRADVRMQDGETVLRVLFGHQEENGYPVSVIWPDSMNPHESEFTHGVVVFEHLIDEFLLALSSL